MSISSKNRTLVLFITAYSLYAAVELYFREIDGQLGKLILIGLILVMVLTILWRYELEDEVQQKISDNATRVGFWATFVTLYLVTLSEGFDIWLQTLVPIWTIPLMAWILGYIISSITYR